MPSPSRPVISHGLPLGCTLRGLCVFWAFGVPGVALTASGFSVALAFYAFLAPLPVRSLRIPLPSICRPPGLPVGIIRMS
eukprot:9168943-Heterocapsa_arctica.AAC.1